MKRIKGFRVVDLDCAPFFGSNLEHMSAIIWIASTRVDKDTGIPPPVSSAILARSGARIGFGVLIAGLVCSFCSLFHCASIRISSFSTKYF